MLHDLRLNISVFAFHIIAIQELYLLSLSAKLKY